MTQQLLFANQASTTLAGTLNTTATTVSVATGTGAEFPTPTGGQWFVLVLSKSGDSAIYEVCHCTGVSGDNLTIVRAQEGTVGQSWAVGDIASNLVTAGTMQYFPQLSDVQTQAGNYAVDTGTANAMVVTLSPVPASLAALAGVPIRIKKIASANTGATTLAVNGFTATAVTTANGVAMTAGQLPLNGTIEVIYNPTLAAFVLQTATGVDGASGVTAGSYTVSSITVDAAGRVTEASSGAIDLGFFQAQQQAASGTGSSETLTVATWVGRTFNTVVTAASWASLTSNQITLAAGTYDFDVSAPASAATSTAPGSTRCRLKVVGGATVAVSPVFPVPGTISSPYGGCAVMSGRLVIGESTIFEVDSFSLSQSQSGYLVSTSGELEIGSSVSFHKVA